MHREGLENFKEICTTKRRDGCDSSSSDDSGKNLEAICAAVQYGRYYAGGDSVEGDGEEEMGFCDGR